MGKTEPNISRNSSAFRVKGALFSNEKLKKSYFYVLPVLSFSMVNLSILSDSSTFQRKNIKKGRKRIAEFKSF